MYSIYVTRCSLKWHNTFPYDLPVCMILVSSQNVLQISGDIAYIYANLECDN